MVRAIVLLVLLATSSAAHAEKRIALLIGNQQYSKDIGPLANPHNDVALLEQSLRVLGFEVIVQRDTSLGDLTRAVSGYARKLRSAGTNAVGFFYYSGHGAADGGVNYLIPVDVKTTETGELWDQSLRLTEITRKLKSEAGNATHFVVFDACRNNLKLRQMGSRGLVQSKGFVPVVQEAGMLIAYATAEGELASDVGAGEAAGPYAKVLAEEIVKPGVEAVTMFRRVQVRVRSTIGQEPWLGFSALGEVHLAGFRAEAAEAWDRAKDTDSVVVLEAFIVRYRETFYADLARARIEELKKQEVAMVVPSKVPSSVSPFDGEWTALTNGGPRCRNKRWRPAVLIEGTNMRMIGYKKAGRLAADGTFEFYIPGMEDDYAVVVGKLAGNAGRGSYKYKSGACSGTMTLHRSQ